MDEDEDGFQFAPQRRQNSVQKAGLLASSVIGGFIVVLGVCLLFVSLAQHRSALFGIIAIVLGVLLVLAARMINRDQLHR